MRLKLLKKEQSLESLAIGANGSRNAIEIFEEETKSRKPCEWRDWSDWREKCDSRVFEEGTKDIKRSDWRDGREKCD